MDNGHRFVVTVYQDGFKITKKHGKWSRDDLFGELGYWPETETWSNVSETLGDLLMQLAKTTQASPKKLLAAIKMEFEEYNDTAVTGDAEFWLKACVSTIVPHFVRKSLQFFFQLLIQHSKLPLTQVVLRVVTPTYYALS